MEGKVYDNESLIARIQQLEQERDELHKDIEQLCMQQAGPNYLSVATRMHFQRTAILEEEIQNLKKKLDSCKRENLNLQEELSEAYLIKSQLADLHNAEVAKGMEAEKQVKFFQGCVAAAFAERDHAVMEAEKAKEKEELMSNKLTDVEKRLEEIMSECLEEKTLSAALKTESEKLEKQNESFIKVINKFYEIRNHVLEGPEHCSLEYKCDCLLHDSTEMWSFYDHKETSTSKYISALEEEVETLRKSMDNLGNKLQMGLEIENHLKKRVCNLENHNIILEEKIKREIQQLLNCHSLHRIHIMDLLNEGYSHLKSTAVALETMIRRHERGEQNLKSLQEDIKLQESEYQDAYKNIDAGSNLLTKREVPELQNAVGVGTADASEALALALQEKVAALLLLSQQEERHLLERNVKAALQRKVGELQRNLLQVTNEKVKVLMELAQLKQENQLLREKLDLETAQGKLLGESEEKRTLQERDGRLKNLLRRTYLRRWVGRIDSNENETDAHLNYLGNISSRANYNMGFARMKIENATLRESLESMEHLTSSVHRLRISLLKVVDSETSIVTSLSAALDNIIAEAHLVKTALGSSLPVSWSADADTGSSDGQLSGKTADIDTESSSEKVDYVSAAGFEMVELLILSAQILKDNLTLRSQRDAIGS